jgi:hypothetical protein
MLQQCHLFHRDSYLSDITTGDGLSISDEAWMGKQSVR